MSDTTTIEIRDDQLEQLKTMKRVDRESYKSVVDRLLEGDTDTEPMRVVPIEDVLGREVPSAQIDQDVMKQLERNYEAIKEATQAAQSADRKMEQL